MLTLLLQSREHLDCSSEGLCRALAGYQNAEEGCADHLIRCVTPLLIHLFAGPFTKPDQVEDLVQEAWLRIHRARRSYRPGEPALPWILSIARHTRVDMYRRHSRNSSHERPLDAVLMNGAPFLPTVQSEIELNDLLSILPESQREVLLMMKVFGMSVEEVARATSSGPSAVKQRAHRAYKAIRQLLSAGRNGGKR